METVATNASAGTELAAASHVRGAKPTRSTRSRAAKENAGGADAPRGGASAAPAMPLGAANRFGYRDMTRSVIKRPTHTPPRPVPPRPTTAPAATGSDETMPVAAAEPVAAEEGEAAMPPQKRATPVAEGSSSASRRRRSGVFTPGPALLRVNEDGGLASDSPPPTPINLTAAVLEILQPEVDEAAALMGIKVRAKKFDYKGIIQQQSELIAQLKHCLTQVVDKSGEVKVRTLAAEEGANSKVQSLAKAKAPMREQIVALTAQLDTLRASHSESSTARSELQARLSALGALAEADKASLAHATAQLEATERELEHERERAEAAEGELAEARHELSATDARADELEGKLRAAGIEHAKQLETLRESIERRTERQRAEYEASLGELQERHDAASAEGAELRAGLEDATRERDELRARASALDEQNAALARERDVTAAELGRSRDEIASKESHLTECLRNLGSMQAEAIERQSELREEKKALSERLERASARADELSAAAVRCARERSVLEHELSAVDATAGRAVEALGEAERARLEGAELLLQAQSELATLKAEHARLATDAAAAAAERDALRAELGALRSSAEGGAAELATERARARDLEVEFRTYKEHCGTSSVEQMNALVRLQRECEALNARFEETRGQLGQREDLTKCLEAQASERAAYVAELEGKLHEAEETRRKLHNTVQELKGNIRVFCRVRPSKDAPAAPDAAAPPSCLDLKPDGASVHIATVSAGEKSAREASHQFGFDKVFAPQTSQADVFDEVSALVQSALDGYKVCIFAYGQTGSGKTYTMQGTADEAGVGIVPRSLKQIFHATRAAEEKGWTYALHASFIEVYNENVKDLLAAPGAAAPNHTIKHDEAFGTVVTDVTRVEVTSAEQVDELARAAARQRSVGCTDMNSVSSRSHAIFMLYLTGTNASVGHTLHGALHLVDLAGSERLSRSHAEGKTLKETMAINKSLSALSDVFTSITNRAGHVPFRNSKLTYLMAPCLSGDGKTLMVVNVAPEVDNSMESLSSLRFASQVNACEIGRPKRSVRAAGDGSAGAERPESRPSLASSSRVSTTSSAAGGGSKQPASRPTSGNGAGAGTKRPAGAVSGAPGGGPMRRPATAR